MSDEDKSEGSWRDTTKWLIALGLSLGAGYLADQADVAKEVAARFKQVGVIISELSSKTAIHGEQIRANERQIQDLKNEILRVQQRTEDELDRHEDTKHE